MTYGEEKARLLGVSTGKRKWLMIAAGSLLTGGAVAVSGTIGFVGLVIPHVTRLLWGDGSSPFTAAVSIDGRRVSHFGGFVFPHRH